MSELVDTYFLLIKYMALKRSDRVSNLKELYPGRQPFYKYRYNFPIKSCSEDHAI